MTIKCKECANKDEAFGDEQCNKCQKRRERNEY